MKPPTTLSLQLRSQLVSECAGCPRWAGMARSEQTEGACCRRQDSDLSSCANRCCMQHEGSQLKPAVRLPPARALAKGHTQTY